MHPLFTQEPLVWLLILASLAGWNAIEARQRGRSSQRSRGASDWTLSAAGILALLAFAGALAASIAALAPIAGESWLPVAIGLAMIWAGHALRAWSVHTLGRFFKLTVAIQEGHRVVDTGPYRVLRHPSYLGTIVVMCGIGVAMGDWVSLAIVLVGTFVAFAIRIPIEERVLLSELGEEYAAYTRRTARLVPGLY